ncbi:hypothetical protein GOBAR_DD36696 [Gossypium barbadense]|nr:hypothetical protein GOBAR_DD36696 [Gossypium barbadense]
MAESICRALRDGALEGELAPAFTIEDSVTSPFALQVFSHVLSQLFSSILAGKSQSLFAFLLFSSRKTILLTFINLKLGDPLGWNDQLAGSGNSTALSNEALVSRTANVFREVKHMDKLYNSIIELGKGLVGGGKIWSMMGIPLHALHARGLRGGSLQVKQVWGTMQVLRQSWLGHLPKPEGIPDI